MRQLPLSAKLTPSAAQSRSLAQQFLLLVAGTVALALASRLSVPMIPVPITMQTFAVTMIGALYGWRLGTLTVLAWLGQAMIGLPVLANGAGGYLPFIGPTAGYLVSFPLMAALVGYATERGIGTNNFATSASVFFAANVMGLVLGTLWLASLIGWEKAWWAGFAPFILGAVLKSILASACYLLFSNRVNRKA